MTFNFRVSYYPQPKGDAQEWVREIEAQTIQEASTQMESLYPSEARYSFRVASAQEISYAKQHNNLIK